MASMESLLRAYEQFLSVPWDQGLAGPQKIWFALYNPLDERRLRYRIPAFELATQRSGHGWRHHDLTDLFPRWMADHEYREAYFESPEDIGMALEEFAACISGAVRDSLRAPPGVDEKTVVAFSGLGSLFGLVRFSEVLAKAEWSIQGRMLVFFPGERDGSNYRLLDARDGWNYHAVPITGQESS